MEKVGVSTIMEGGKKIVVVDCSGDGVKDKDKILSTLVEGNKVIAECGPKSALIITNVTNMNFDGEISDAFKAYASRNNDYVKASAIVGLSGIQKIVFNAVKLITGRDYYLTSSMDDAKNYLISKG